MPALYARHVCLRAGTATPSFVHRIEKKCHFAFKGHQAHWLICKPPDLLRLRFALQASDSDLRPPVKRTSRPKAAPQAQPRPKIVTRLGNLPLVYGSPLGANGAVLQARGLLQADKKRIKKKVKGAPPLFPPHPPSTKPPRTNKNYSHCESLSNTFPP